MGDEELVQEDWDNINKILQAGDVVLTINRQAWLSNFIQRLMSDAIWFHSALAFNSGEVIESVDKGVRRCKLFQFLNGKDYFVILRPNFLTSEEVHESVFWALSKVGFGYDWAFEWSNSKNELYYCSELIWKAFQTGKLGNSPFTLRKRNGVLTAIPQDFFNASSKFDIVYTSKNCKF
jgi:uncharacterized protein YycO